MARHQVRAMPLALAHASVTASSGLRCGNRRVDLERAHKAATNAALRVERGDVLAAEQNLAAVRPQHAGHQVDQRGLAGAVRPDQRVTHALRQLDLDVAGNDQRAEALVEALRREGGLAHDAALRQMPFFDGAAVSQPNQRWPRVVPESA